MGLISFNEFKREVSTSITDSSSLPEGTKVEIRENLINNSVIRSALLIKEPGRRYAPNIYLDSFYSRYLSGEDFQEMLEEILQLYELNKNNLQFDLELLTSFDCMRDRIIMRLMNYERNRKLLEDCPYLMWQDLAVTFRWVASQDEEGVSSSLIGCDLMKSWGTSPEELYELARENMPRCFPARVMNMYDMIECMHQNQDDDEELDDLMTEDLDNLIPLFVMSNEQKINGATAVLYPDMLKTLSLQCHGNFYILPSSVHELIVLPYPRADQGETLKGMVKNVNEEVISNDDYLSDHVYYYDCISESITMQ